MRVCACLVDTLGIWGPEKATVRIRRFYHRYCHLLGPISYLQSNKPGERSIMMKRANGHNTKSRTLGLNRCRATTKARFPTTNTSHPAIRLRRVTAGESTRIAIIQMLNNPSGYLSPQLQMLKRPQLLNH
jgi:hypothetical protein